MHMTNGKTRSMQVSGPSMGYSIHSFTLTEQDMRELASWSGDKLHDWLGIMYTRFAPPKFDATFEEL